MAKRNLRYNIEDGKKKKGGFKKVLGFFLLFLIIAGLSFFGVKHFGKFIPTDKIEADEGIPYTAGQNVASVSLKNTFVVSTIDGIKMVNRSGESENEEASNAVSGYVKIMKSPKMISNNKTALAFDSMGNTAVLFNEAGVMQFYSFTGNIINVKMSNSGKFVFVTEDTNSKAQVKVYGNEGNEILTWYSGKGYVTDATLNNKNDSMAVVTNEISEGKVSSKLLMFNLDSAEPYMGKTIGDALTTSVSYYDGYVLIVCDDGVYSATKDGEMKVAYSFSGKKMRHFKVFDNGNMLLISEGTGDNYLGTVIDKKGKAISNFSIESFLEISDIDKDEFLVIKRRGILSVNKRGKIKKEIPLETEVKDAKYFKNSVAVVTTDEIIYK